MLYVVNLLQRCLFLFYWYLCGGTKCVWIYFFTDQGCTPGILFLRLSVLMRHSSSLYAIVQQCSQTSCVFTKSRYFLGIQLNHLKSTFGGIWDFPNSTQQSTSCTYQGMRQKPPASTTEDTQSGTQRGVLLPRDIPEVSPIGMTPN